MNIFFERKFIIQGIIILTGLVLLARLFYIQVVDDSYFLSANNNVLRKLIVYPSRGVIFDRNGKILVKNEPVYDLMVIPKQTKPIDTGLFCDLIGITKKGFADRMQKARRESPYKASIFEKQLSSRTFASFQEKLYEFPGFFVQNRTVRKYPDSIAAQLLGYIGEVDENLMKKTGGYYQPGDYIGISGIERSYEDVLRGQRGVRLVMVDVFNRQQGSYENGAYDTVAIAGEKLVSSLDYRIQKLGEDLMRNKKGSIIAIEPSTGELLAFISSPTYDPNLLVGRERGKNYGKLVMDENKPLFIRPIMAQYPPGSSFKVIQALIGQQGGYITPETRFPCGGGYRLGSRLVRCEHVHPPLNLMESIQYSCNTYYCWEFRKMIDDGKYASAENNYKAWRDQVEKFGIGKKLNIDLPNELKGLLPTTKFYDKFYGRGHWKFSNIISLSFGQGELGITPLQMANLMAIIANKGYYYNPHLVKSIGDKKYTRAEYTKKNYVGVDSQYFNVVQDGMEKVVQSGTAFYSRIKDIRICGKTGTVQNPHGENHSVFVAFAPRENPKIAIAVVVENAGYGASWAAPIASVLIEKYLTDTVTRPSYFMDRLYNGNFIDPKNIVKKEE
jgi:penicillin-binding protein 2